MPVDMISKLTRAAKLHVDNSTAGHVAFLLNDLGNFQIQMMGVSAWRVLFPHFINRIVVPAHAAVNFAPIITAFHQGYILILIH